MDVHMGDEPEGNHRNRTSPKTVDTCSERMVLDNPQGPPRAPRSGADRQVLAPLPGLRRQDHCDLRPRHEYPARGRSLGTPAFQFNCNPGPQGAVAGGTPEWRPMQILKIGLAT